MKPRITVMTVGVDDVERSLTVYREELGLPTQGIIDVRCTFLRYVSREVLLERHTRIRVVLIPVSWLACLRQIYPQSRCLDCLKAAQDQLKQCLDSAISQEDKKSCAERQEAQAKVCEKGECEIERAKNTNRNDVLPQKK